MSSFVLDLESSYTAHKYILEEWMKSLIGKWIIKNKDKYSVNIWKIESVFYSRESRIYSISGPSVYDSNLCFNGYFVKRWEDGMASIIKLSHQEVKNFKFDQYSFLNNYLSEKLDIELAKSLLDGSCKERTLDSYELEEFF